MKGKYEAFLERHGKMSDDFEDLKRVSQNKIDELRITKVNLEQRNLELTLQLQQADSTSQQETERNMVCEHEIHHENAIASEHMQATASVQQPTHSSQSETSSCANIEEVEQFQQSEEEPKQVDRSIVQQSLLISQTETSQVDGASAGHQAISFEAMLAEHRTAKDGREAQI